MTSIDPPAHAEPLGFWLILGRTVAMSVRHIGIFLVIAVPPWGVIILLGSVLDNVAVGILLSIVGAVLWALTCSVLTHAAFLLHHGDRIDLTELCRGALGKLPAMLVCFTIAMIAINIAYQFLIIPGIYISGLFAVILPAAVIEKGGMDSISRCERLTRRYRWSTGTLWFLLTTLVSLIVVSVSVGLVAAVGEDAADFDTGISATGWAAIITAATIYNITTCVLAALIYARLLEIEDGYARIEDVFE